MFYSKAQIEMGKRRMEEVGRRPPARFTKKKVRFIRYWHSALQPNHHESLADECSGLGHRILQDLASVSVDLV